MLTLRYCPTRYIVTANWSREYPELPLMVINFRDHDRAPDPLLLDPNIDSLLIIAADDEEEGETAITWAQAKQVAQFAQTADEIDAEVIICCEGGVGRSAGCIAALLWTSKDPGLADEAVFNHGRISPNKRIFELVREAIDGPADMQEQAAIDAAFARQHQLFDEYHELTPNA